MPRPHILAALLLAAAPSLVHAQGRAVRPNLAHPNPAWTLTPPTMDFGPPKAVRTLRIMPGGTPEPPAPTAGPGGYFVQVSSQRSAADAQASFEALQAKYPTVLGARRPVIARIDIGGRSGVFYRVLLGPYDVAEKANQTCEELKAAGGQCIVRRN